jgi:AbrB family looped-hinge helix DNA binding protein
MKNMTNGEVLKVAKVSSNDSTLLVYLPKAVCDALRLKKGSYVVLRIKDKKLVIEPLNIETTSEKEQKGESENEKMMRKISGSNTSSQHERNK